MAVFTNHKADTPVVPETGNLTISKTVTGSGNQTKAFTFTVTLTDATGTPLNERFAFTGNGVADGTISTGETISLAHGQSITISGIPVGTQYTVTETEANQDGYTTISTGASGEITKNSAVAAFTNNFSKTPDKPTEPPKEGISVVKASDTNGKTVKPDEQITYKITVTNTGETVLTGIRVRDYIPANTHFISADNDGERGAINGKQHVTWFIVSLNPGQSITLSFVVQVDSCVKNGTEITNTALYEVTDDPAPPSTNDPDDPENPTNTVINKVGTTPSNPYPQTGDNSHLLLYGVLMLLSLAGLTTQLLFAYRRRKKQ